MVGVIIVLILIAVTAVLIVWGAAKIQRLEECHPPDDDGITLLGDIENEHGKHGL